VTGLQNSAGKSIVADLMWCNLGRLSKYCYSLGARRPTERTAARVVGDSGPSSNRFWLTWPLRAWTHVVEPDQIDILAFTVLGNFEQIDET
jgi:hypothetical protein